MGQWIADLRSRLAGVPRHVWIALALGLASVILGIWAIRRQQQGQPLLPSVQQAVPGDAGASAAQPVSNTATPVTSTTTGASSPTTTTGASSPTTTTGASSPTTTTGTVGAITTPAPIHGAYFQDGVAHGHGVVSLDENGSQLGPSAPEYPLHKAFFG